LDGKAAGLHCAEAARALNISKGTLLRLLREAPELEGSWDFVGSESKRRVFSLQDVVKIYERRSGRTYDYQRREYVDRRNIPAFEERLGLYALGVFVSDPDRASLLEQIEPLAERHAVVRETLQAYQERDLLPSAGP